MCDNNSIGTQSIYQDRIIDGETLTDISRRTAPPDNRVSSLYPEINHIPGKHTAAVNILNTGSRQTAGAGF